MNTNITVNVNGEAVPYTLLKDINVPVDSEEYDRLSDEVSNTELDFTKWWTPSYQWEYWTKEVDMITRHNNKYATQEPVPIRTMPKFSKFTELMYADSHCNDEYYDGCMQKVVRAHYGLYSNSATVLLFCYDYNLLPIESRPVDVVCGNNAVVFPINGDTFIYSDCKSNYSYGIETDIDSLDMTVTGPYYAETDITAHTEVRETTLVTSSGGEETTITVAPINAKINRIIAMRLSYNEFINTPRTTTASAFVGAFLCPKSITVPNIETDIHTTDFGRSYFLDSNNRLYAGKHTGSGGSLDHYYSSFVLLNAEDSTEGNILARFQEYITTTYSGTSQVKIMCAGLHNNTVLITYVCSGSRNIPTYGTSRNARGYFTNTFPNSVPIEYYDAENDTFGHWGIADFSIIPYTYSRILISAIGDRNGTSSLDTDTGSNILTFALYGTSDNDTGDYYIVNGTIVQQLDGSYLFTGTTYQKIPLKTNTTGQSRSAQYGVIYQANGATFFAQALNNWIGGTGNPNGMLGYDFAHYLLAPIPTGNTIEVTTNKQSLTFGVTQMAISGGAFSARTKFRKAAYPLSGVGGRNKFFYTFDGDFDVEFEELDYDRYREIFTNTNQYGKYAIVSFDYDNCPILFDIALNNGNGVTFDGVSPVTVTFSLQDNNEIDFGE